MKANYFINCENLDEARKVYYKLAMLLHPDKGGKTADFQELQNQFENFTPGKEKFKGEFDQWQAAEYMIIIDQLMKIPNIIITVCGSWIWISGDTKPVKEEIKNVTIEGSGFKRGFSKNKLQWYFSPENYKKYNKKKYDFEEIKEMFGADEVETKGRAKIAA